MTTRKVEDYLEAIGDLLEERGYVKAKDIADRLAISRPSVSEMLRKLDESGYITYEKYGGIAFRPEGRRLAEEIKRRHTLLVEFLKIMGVSEENAQKDACKFEHDISPETIGCLIRFVEFINLLPEGSKGKEYFKYSFKEGDSGPAPANMKKENKEL